MSLVCPVGPEANGLVVGPEHCARLVIENPILTLEEMQVRPVLASGFSVSVSRSEPPSPPSHSFGMYWQKMFASSFVARRVS